MIWVPLAWQLPRLPPSPHAASQRCISAGGNTGTAGSSGLPKQPQSKSTGQPISSQWPLGVSLPVLVSAAAP